MPVSRKRKLKSHKRKLSEQGTFHNGPSYAVSDARELEKRFLATLERCKASLSNGKVTTESAEVLVVLQRIGAEMADFTLWLDDSPETEWLRKAS
jgi:hypothetical protein